MYRNNKNLLKIMRKNILIMVVGLLGSNLYKFLNKKYNVYLLDKKKFLKKIILILIKKVFLGDYLDKKLKKIIINKNKRYFSYWGLNQV